MKNHILATGPARSAIFFKNTGSILKYSCLAARIYWRKINTRASIFMSLVRLRSLILSSATEAESGDSPFTENKISANSAPLTSAKDEYRKLCEKETSIPLFARDWWQHIRPDACCGNNVQNGHDNNPQIHKYIGKIKMLVLAKRYNNCPKLLVPAHTLNALPSQLPAILINSIFGLAASGFLMLAERMVGSLISVSTADVFRQQISQFYITGRNCKLQNFNLSIYSIFYPVALFACLYPGRNEEYQEICAADAPYVF